MGFYTSGNFATTSSSTDLYSQLAKLQQYNSDYNTGVQVAQVAGNVLTSIFSALASKNKETEGAGGVDDNTSKAEQANANLEQVKEEIEANKGTNITKEVLEDEISKTMYIKDLKEKIKQYEEENEDSKEINPVNSSEISELEETAEDVLTEQLKNIAIETKTDSKESSQEEKPQKETSPKRKKSPSKKKNPPKKKVPEKVNHQSRRINKYASKTKKK